jgi:hypothetical protein
MIPFHFLPCLIALAGIAISYTVNSDCGNRESNVNDWVIEARFLFERAAMVLESRTPDIKNILQACLGPSANDDDFKIVHG